MRRLLVVAIAALCPATAPAAELSGRVIAVHDGDTLTLLAEGRKLRLSLSGIDAPELDQRYGWKALRSLKALCRGKAAKAVERGKDDEGRLLASVSCDGEGGAVDASAEQVKRGLAWVFRTYLPLGSPLYELETSARLLQRGLWQDKDPVPPWEWRKQHAAASRAR
ncbi:MAG TPA: thermonuclease family protein [Burkholderiales bacterium]